MSGMSVCSVICVVCGVICAVRYVGVFCVDVCVCGVICVDG